jgi:hypothetical protein
MIGLQTANQKSFGGSVSFDLSLENTSRETISTPLTLMVVDISSASGRVTVRNSGNGKSGVGATWDYSGLVGDDNLFTEGEISGSRNLEFHNPAKEQFTVTFRVVGEVASHGRNGFRKSTSGNSKGSAGDDSTSVFDRSAIGPLTNAVLSVTYDPWLNQVTWHVMRQ